MNNKYDQWLTYDNSQDNVPIESWIEDNCCAHCGYEHFNKYITIDESTKDFMCMTCIEKHIYMLTGFKDFDAKRIEDEPIKPSMSLHTMTTFDNGDKDIYEKTWYYFYVDDKYQIRYYTSQTNYYKYNGLGVKVNQKLDYQILPNNNLFASVCSIKKTFNNVCNMDKLFLKIDSSFEVEI